MVDLTNPEDAQYETLNIVGIQGVTDSNGY